tara:strand:+ start:1372 stop:1623 length:252 start_codon:yes stop_codon:yes gene_type:complete
MKDPWKNFKVEKCLGLKQMHPMQVETLMDFIGLSLMAGAESGEDDLMEQIENKADELIRMFGGSGIRIKTTDDLPDGFKKGLH